MEIVSVNCTSCGAPINVPPDLDNFNCAFCGAALVIKRGEGYVAVKLVEQVSRSIHDAGVQTQTTIREGTQETKLELQRLQITQQLSALQIQLSAVQAEIRVLERQKADKKIKRQLSALRSQETALISQIRTLRASNIPGIGVMPVQQVPGKGIKTPPAGYAGKDWTTTLILCVLFGWLGFHRFYTGHFSWGLVYLLSLGVAGIGWVLDIILILTNHYRDQYNLPLNKKGE